MHTTMAKIRATGLSAAVVVAAIVVVGDLSRDPAPATRVGEAGVALGDETARAVERVSYRQDVERIGDVVVVDGAPRDAITDERIAAMWAVVDDVWPHHLRDRLAQLSVVRGEPRGLVGVVHPSAVGGWIISLDLADLDDLALVEETIVHELSHVVTLGPDVFTFGDVDECGGVQISLGCAAPGTVLAGFADRFWSPGSDEEADFVNEYAMSGAHEDLAETFTAWVIDWPVEGAAVDAKIEFLAADPGLAHLADALRDRVPG